MTTRSSLIKKIENFYKIAVPTYNQENDDDYEEPATDYSKYEDPKYKKITKDEPAASENDGLYSLAISKIAQISNESNDFKNQDIANELLLMAELYKKAIEINGGYSQVLQKIKVAAAEIDSSLDDLKDLDDEDEEFIRDLSMDLLNDLGADLRERSKVSPLKQMDESSAIAQLKTVKDTFISNEARSEMESQKSVYEKGKPGAETGRNISAPAILETPEKYAKQIINLKSQLESEKDINTKSNINEQINVLVSLLKQMNIVSELSDKLKITPNDNEVKSELFKASKTLGELRTKRRYLNGRLSTVILGNEMKDLESQFHKSTNNQERKWIAEKINLIKLRLSDDLQKRDEIQARKTLINSMGTIDSHGDFQALNISNENISRLQEAISKGQKNKVLRSVYDRNRVQQKGMEQGRDYVPTAPSVRGGGRVPLNIDYSTATFPMLLKKFREANNTAIADSRKYIVRPNEKGDPALDPFVKEISTAIRKKNKQAQYEAVNKLREEIIKTLVKSTSLKGYIQSIRMNPHFKKIEENLFELAEKQDKEGRWLLLPEEFDSVYYMMKEIDKLKKIYSKYYMSPEAKKYSEQPYAFYKSSIKCLSAIEDYIAKNILSFYEGSGEEVRITEQGGPRIDPSISEIPKQMKRDELQKFIQEQDEDIEADKKPIKKMIFSNNIVSRIKILSKLIGIDLIKFAKK